MPSDPLENLIAIRGKHIVKPMKSLNDSHGWSPRPVEAARSGRLEIDHELAELNGAEPGVRMNRHLAWNGIRQAQLICSGEAVWK